MLSHRLLFEPVENISNVLALFTEINIFARTQTLNEKRIIINLMFAFDILHNDIYDDKLNTRSII